jgi:hypothetical protein
LRNTVFTVTTLTGPKITEPWWRVLAPLYREHRKNTAIERIKAQPFFQSRHQIDYYRLSEAILNWRMPRREPVKMDQPMRILQTRPQNT